jgi:hypothetical protein
MIITNVYGLPETITNILARPQYSKGKANLSVTELMSSPRIVQLKRKHWEELTEDASEMVWSLFGTAIHNILEHGKDEHHIVEERVFTVVDGFTISGAIDLQEVYEDGTVISDYKTTSVYAVMNQKIDWEYQLNCYAYLLHKAKGVTVKKLQIVAIVRDWSRRDTVREGYPKAPIVVIDIPLWPVERQEAYIKQRIHLQESAFFDIEVNGEAAECTPEEMWEKPEYFAVKKDGGVRAKSVHEKREDAERALAQANEKAKKGETFLIEHRPGARTRCEGFCQVAAFCSQHKKYLSTKPTQGEI